MKKWTFIHKKILEKAALRVYFLNKSARQGFFWIDSLWACCAFASAAVLSPSAKMAKINYLSVFSLKNPGNPNILASFN